MKMTKKILLGAIAVLAIAFNGCKFNEDAANAISGGKIDYINTSTTEYFRCFETRATKHYDAIATFEITPNGTDCDGVSGYMFGVTQNEDKTYNFGVVSLRIKDDDLQGYISWYYRVAGKDKLTTPEDNFVDKNGKAIGEDGCLASETQILPTSGSDTWETIKEDYCSVGNTAKVVVVVDATGSDDKKGNNYIRAEQPSDGEYYVRIFTADKLDSKTGLPAKNNDGYFCETPTINKTIPVNITENKDAKTGKPKRVQKDIGYYFNVYKRQHLTSKIKFSDYRGEALVD